MNILFFTDTIVLFDGLDTTFCNIHNIIPSDTGNILNFSLYQILFHMNTVY